MKFRIESHGTLLSLADCARYRSFVSGEWHEERRLEKHLLAEFERRTILSWGTGLELDWLIEVRPGITATPGFREFIGYMECSDGALHLLSHDSLTMAAQFDDHLLPDRETAGYCIALANGRYRVRVVQCLDPSGDAPQDGDAAEFVLEYERCDGPADTLDAVPWAESEFH